MHYARQLPLIFISGIKSARFSTGKVLPYSKTIATDSYLNSIDCIYIFVYLNKESKSWDEATG